MSTVAIIPARGGSKGIPLKNLAFVHGQPLIDWTIETALQSEYIDRVIVSTDNAFIAAHALGFDGVDVFMRPDAISVVVCHNCCTCTCRTMQPWCYAASPSCAGWYYHTWNTWAWLGCLSIDQWSDGS